MSQSIQGNNLKKVAIETKRLPPGQLVVAVNGTRLALGQGIAKKIMVKANGRREG